MRNLATACVSADGTGPATGEPDGDAEEVVAAAGAKKVDKLRLAQVARNVEVLKKLPAWDTKSKTHHKDKGKGKERVSSRQHCVKDPTVVNQHNTRYLEQKNDE